VYDDSQDLALLIVEAEDASTEKPEGGAAEGPGGFLKEELLLSAKVEKDDIYARQQGGSGLLAERWSDVDGCRYAYCLDRAFVSA